MPTSRWCPAFSFRAEDRGLRGSTRIFLGSAGCQPAGFGNLPKQSSPNQISLSGTFCWKIFPARRRWRKLSSNSGGKGIRTPDFQLAKLALYQLSYAPGRIAECRLPICDCKEQRKMPDIGKSRIAECCTDTPRGCCCHKDRTANLSPVTCRPIRLPSRSSAVVPAVVAFFPSALWQLFRTGARRGRHRPETHRRCRRWPGQVESRTKQLLWVLVAPKPVHRAKTSRLRFLCQVLPPV